MARNTEQGRWKVKQYGGSSSKPRPFEGKGLSSILRGRFFPAVPPPLKKVVPTSLGRSGSRHAQPPAKRVREVIVMIGP